MIGDDATSAVRDGPDLSIKLGARQPFLTGAKLSFG